MHSNAHIRKQLNMITKCQNASKYQIKLVTRSRSQKASKRPHVLCQFCFSHTFWKGDQDGLRTFKLLTAQTRQRLLEMNQKGMQESLGVHVLY